MRKAIHKRNFIDIHKEFTEVVLRLKYPIVSISSIGKVKNQLITINKVHMFSQKMFTPSNIVSWEFKKYSK